MTGQHQGKTVLVTGGASGIGVGIVDRLAREGANVVSFDLNAISPPPSRGACRAP